MKILMLKLLIKTCLGEKYAIYPVLLLLSHMHVSKVYISHDYISFYSYHPAIRSIIYASIKIQMTPNIHEHVKTRMCSSRNRSNIS